MRATRLAALALMASLVLATFANPAIAQAPTPGPTPSPAQPVEDKPPLWDVEGRARYAIAGWFSDLLAAAVEPIVEGLGRAVFSTPRVDKHPRIAELWKFSLIVADALLVLLVLTGSGLAVASDEITSRVTLKEILPRLFVAGATANLSILAVGYLITLSNSLAAGFVGAAVDSSDFTVLLTERLFSATGSVFLVLLALVVLALGILVLVAYVGRVAVLIVLTAAAPLFLVTHTLRQSEEWARTWWRAVGAMLAAPVLQALLMAAGFRVFLSGDLLGLPGSGLIDLLVIGCLLYLMFKIPFWAFNTALSGAGSRAWRAAKQQARALARAVAP